MEDPFHLSVTCLYCKAETKTKCNTSKHTISQNLGMKSKQMNKPDKECSQTQQFEIGMEPYRKINRTQ